MQRIRARKRGATILCLSIVAGATPIAAFSAKSLLHSRQLLSQQPHEGTASRLGTLPRHSRTAVGFDPRTLSSRTALTSLSTPNIAVSLDKPLLTDAGTLIPYEQPSRWLGGTAILRWLSSWGSSKVTMALMQIAAITLLGALLVSLLRKSSASVNSSSPSTSSWRTLWGIASGKWQRFWETRGVKSSISSTSFSTEGIPLTFPTDNDGYGVCTLKSKKPLGKTKYIQYDFALPDPDNTLPLDMGQELELCCLDNDNAVANGHFYVYKPQATPPLGSFSLLIPNIDAISKASVDAGGTSSGIDAAIRLLGRENANFARVLKQDLKVGDEVAIRPGPQRLHYRGQFLPVTDMVYVCFGTGVVPVLEQVRSVLSNGEVDISSVFVVWINEETNDFDVIADLLEKEYFKYSKTMAVACVVENVASLSSLADNVEINASVPDFRPGAMAVLSGPAPLVQRAKEYMEDRGYPSDTICVL